MPLQLPGFYWDETRQRYFPITSRSTQPHGWQPNPPENAVASSSTPPAHTKTSTSKKPLDEKVIRPRKKKHFDLFRASYPHSHAARQRIKLDTMADMIATRSKGRILHHADFPCSSFDVLVSADDNDTVMCTGDKGGWLQSCRIAQHGFTYGSVRDLYLGSEVTALCHSDDLRVAVSFGPSCKIAVQNLTRHEDVWTVMNLPDKVCHDIRVADLSGSRLALGAATRGMLLPNIEYSWHYEVLPTGSDVFSICQRDSLLYTGTRNGSVKVFDVRQDTKWKGQPLFGERYKAETRSITHLQVVNEWQMVVSTIRGDLELQDLRFARPDAPPLKLFTGHVNSYHTKLGIATSPCASFLFAAGQDNRIRAWNIQDPSSSDPINVQAESPRKFTPLSQPHSQTPTRTHPQSQPESGFDRTTTPHSLAHTTFSDTVIALQVRHGGRRAFGFDADGRIHTRSRRQAEFESADAYGGKREDGEMMTLWAAEGKQVWVFGIGYDYDTSGGRTWDM